MKKVSFNLSEELHQALKDSAAEHGTSMSAICREALTGLLGKEQESSPLDDFFSEDYISSEVPWFEDSEDDDLFAHLKGSSRWGVPYDAPEIQLFEPEPPFEVPMPTVEKKKKPKLKHRLSRHRAAPRPPRYDGRERWLMELWA